MTPSDRPASGPPSRPTANRLLAILFPAVIAGPCVGTMLGLPPLVKLDENRRPAGWPPCPRTLPGVLETVPKYEAYFKDHFAFREVLIRAHNRLLVEWLRTSSSPQVILGRDGWEFFCDLSPGSDYDRTRPFTPEELRLWQERLERRQQWLARRGCRYLFVIAPDKQSIYPEFLPPAVRRGGPTRLDQLAGHLRTHSTVRLVDLRPALLSGKCLEPVYLKHDTHWNWVGSADAGGEIVRALSGWYPRIRPRRRAEHTSTRVTFNGGDLRLLLGFGAEVTEPCDVLRPVVPVEAVEERRSPVPGGPDVPVDVVWTSDDTTLPRAVIVHDSFGIHLRPYLAQFFRRARFVEDAGFTPELIGCERPDVVIEEWVERKLGFMVPEDPVPPPTSTGPR